MVPKMPTPLQHFLPLSVGRDCGYDAISFPWLVFVAWQRWWDNQRVTLCYYAGQKIQSVSAVRWYRKTWVNLLAKFPGGSDSKSSARNVGDTGSIPGSGTSPGEGNGNPLQYSCLENPMDRGAWWATAHRVTKSRTGLSDFTFTFKHYNVFYVFVLAAGEIQSKSYPAGPKEASCHSVEKTMWAVSRSWKGPLLTASMKATAVLQL